jgi:hypothetical protein
MGILRGRGKQAIIVPIQLCKAFKEKPRITV